LEYEELQGANFNGIDVKVAFRRSFEHENSPQRVKFNKL
jgi:hypothetical protein